MSKLNKSLDEDKAVTMLVLGTEQRNVFILDQTGMSIKKTMLLKSVPTFIETTG